MATYMGNMLLNSLVCGVLFVLIIGITPLFKDYKKLWKYVVLFALAIKLIIPLELFSMPGAMLFEIGNQNLRIESEAEKQLENSDQLPENTYEDISNQEVDGNLEEIVDGNAEGSTDYSHMPKTQEINENRFMKNIEPYVESLKAFSRANLETILIVMFILWLIIAAGGIILYIIIYQYHRYSISRWSAPIKEKKVRDLFEEEKKTVGVSPNIEIKRCRRINTPMTVGLIKPQVLVPVIGTDYEEMRYVLRHELIHIKRRDMYTKIIFVLAKNLHWFNPLVHKLAKEAYENLELMCDDEVVESLNKHERIKYNEALVDVARKQAMYNDVTNIVFSFGFVQRKNDLKSRLINIMDMSKRKKGYALTLILCVLVAVLGGTMKFVEANVEEIMIQTGFVEEKTEEETEEPTEAPTEEATEAATEQNLDMNSILEELESIESDRKIERDNERSEFLSDNKDEVISVAEKIVGDKNLWRNVIYNMAYAQNVLYKEYRDEAEDPNQVSDSMWFCLAYTLPALDETKLDKGSIDIVQINNNKYVRVNEELVKKMFEYYSAEYNMRQFTKDIGYYSREEKAYFFTYKYEGKRNANVIDYEIVEDSEKREGIPVYFYHCKLKIADEDGVYTIKLDVENNEIGFCIWDSKYSPK